jgi:ATP-dependent Lhr-like helicase
VNNFERLHPALQHHIVNSLGWRELRPFQEEIIAPILDGEHVIVLAPTAGGKTEAAFFPVLSRMLSEGWSGLSVLYLCPIRALLNNLQSRLQRYCNLLGRSTSLWHGDVGTGARRRILQENPDCLLSTPESLEVMLVSTNVDARSLFANLRVVIVDEIHAFAGDDRGWHLLSVLERITRLSGRELQRVGLSATVGNPGVLIEWLAGSCDGAKRVLAPPNDVPQCADVKLDYVGSLQNAAVVISRLHRGEKRLVFVDSRSRAEQLGMELRQLGVTAFVTHSSLSQEQRHQAEDAFANRDDCVIVATSVLELGVDVGNLDRVIQIDSPATVASFLQRMGRTGRRAGSSRNCLFLATREEALIQAAGLIELWSRGYVEPIFPPPEPFHVLAQQIMALILQEGGIGKGVWRERLDRVQAFQRMSPADCERVIQWMLDHEILWDEEGMLGIGRGGEEQYGRRHFMELLSVFLSPPLFRVLHGRQELGSVDELTFLGKRDGPRVLLLGGRSWRVTHVDWARKTAYVETTDEHGQSQWKGGGRGLRYDLCQAIKSVLASAESRNWWSQRAAGKLVELREDFAWLMDNSSVVVGNSDGELTWWTFAGIGANATLSAALSEVTQSRVAFESFSLTFDSHLGASEVERAISHIRQQRAESYLPLVDDNAIESLKFADCLPVDLGLRILGKRLEEAAGVRALLRSPIRFVAS